MSFTHKRNFAGFYRKGKYFILSFQDQIIQKVSCWSSTFFFEWNGNASQLEIHGYFDIELSGELYHSTGLYSDFVDFLEVYLAGKKVLMAKTDKYGTLRLEIEGDVVITVPDGPYENWHYTSRQQSIYLHGGCGSFG